MTAWIIITVVLILVGAGINIKDGEVFVGLFAIALALAILGIIVWL